MTRHERGEVSLVSVLVACTLLIVVLGASLSIFEGFIAKAGDATLRVDAEDAARTATDRIARNLRNVASPTTENPTAVDRLTGNDLIFKTVNAAGPSTATNATATQRVRYCLGAGGTLHQQTQALTNANDGNVPASTSCPGTGWTSNAVAATGIVNAGVPVFTYDTTDPVSVSTVHVALLVATDRVRLPGPTRLSTGVFLRNQNRRPTAGFTVTRDGAAFVFNGSASADLDSDPLQYSWTVDGVSVGSGITYTHTPNPAWTSGSAHQVALTVKDPAGLTGQMSQTVTG